MTTIFENYNFERGPKLVNRRGPFLWRDLGDSHRLAFWFRLYAKKFHAVQVHLPEKMALCQDEDSSVILTLAIEGSLLSSPIIQTICWQCQALFVPMSWHPDGRKWCVFSRNSSDFDCSWQAVESSLRAGAEVVLTFAKQLVLFGRQPWVTFEAYTFVAMSYGEHGMKMSQRRNIAGRDFRKR
jgi:hypothetical protein